MSYVLKIAIDCTEKHCGGQCAFYTREQDWCKQFNTEVFWEEDEEDTVHERCPDCLKAEQGAK